MKTMITLLMFGIALPSWGTVIAGAQDCPVQFEGRVKEVIEPIGNTEYFSTNKVVFENQKTLKGEVSEKMLVDVLRDGPFKIESEKDYLVKLRNGKLCWIEAI